MKLQTPMLTIPSALFIFLLTSSEYSLWLGKVKNNSDSKSAKVETLAQQTLNLEIARKRFENGCTPIVTSDKSGQQSWVSLKENMAIYGRGNSKLPLADGTVVCSGIEGGTGVMSGGVITNYAQNIQAGNEYFKSK